MANVFKGLTIKIGADTTKLSTALRKAKDSARGVSSELKAVGKALKVDPGNISLLTRQQELYKQKIEATEKELEALRTAESQIGEANMNTDEWTKLQSEIAICEGKLKEYNKALEKSQIEQEVSNSTLGQFANKLEKISPTLKTVGGGMQTVGRALSTTVTPALIGTGAASIAAAVDIDTALTGVKKTVNGTEEEYEGLKKAAIEFSKTNAVDPSQVLDIQALGAQLGFTIDELDMFSQVVSGLDIATDMDAETAAMELAKFANVTEMSHDDVENYGASIVGLGNNFAATESEISTMAMRLASAGHQIGLTEADTLGLATALSSAGMEAEAGGSAISTIMMQIDKDVANGSKSLETWASTAGMSADEFSAAWKEKPVEALTALITGLDGATEEGSSMAVMLDELGITSIRQSDAMRRLAGNSDNVTKAIDVANEEWEKNSALNKEVENRNESLAGKMQILKNKVTAVAESVGKPLADALMDVVDAAEPLIQNIAKAAESFSEMSESEQKTVLKSLAMVAALGPMLSILGKGVSAVGSMSKGLKGLATFFAKVGTSTASATAATKANTTANTLNAKSTKAATTAMKASSVAMGALKTSAIGLGVALAGMFIGKIVEEFENYRQKAEQVEAATTGLEEAMATMNAGSEPFASAMKDAEESVDAFCQKAREAIDEQGNLAKEMQETWEEIGTSEAVLDDAVATIEKYAGKTGLTSVEQQKLTDAVNTYNEVTGSSVEVTDASNGKLSVSTDELKENAQAWIDNAKAQAYQEQLVDLLKKQTEQEQILQDSHEQIAQKQERLNELTKNSAYISLADFREKEKLEKELEELGATYEDTAATYAANADSQAELIAKQYDEEAALERLKESMVTYIASNAEMSEALSNAGISTKDFANKMADLGFSVTDLNNLTTEQMQGIVDSFSNGGTDIIEVCNQLGINVPDKLKKAVEDGTVAIESGGINLKEASIGIKDGMLTAFDPVSGEFKQISQDAMNEFCKELGIKAPDVKQMTKDLKDGAVYELDPATGKFKQTGEEAAKNFAEAISGEKEEAKESAEEVKESAEEGVDGTEENFFQEGLNSVKEFVNGLGQDKGETKKEAKEQKAAALFGIDGTQSEFAQEALNSVKDWANGLGKKAAEAKKRAKQKKDDAVGAVKGTASKFMTEAGNAASKFASNIGNKAAQAKQNASSLANAAKNAIKTGISGALSWGSHLGQNFAAGISGAINLVKNAANNVANVVKKILGHTVPEDGPLRNGGRGEIEWGEHTIQNYIDGMKKKMPELQKTVNAITETVADPLKGTALESGKLDIPTNMSIKVTNAGLSKNDVYRAIVEALTKADTGNSYNIDMNVDAKDLSGVNAVDQLVKVLEMEKLANPSRR